MTSYHHHGGQASTGTNQKKKYKRIDHKSRQCKLLNIENITNKKNR